MEAEAFYDQVAGNEWGRLERHRTEFAVTLKALDEYLPRPPCPVLDVGGGPGRYAIALAQRGYAVTLLDISGQSLALAQDKAAEAGVALQEVVHASAVDLGELHDAAFGGVLLMGPLYHLLPAAERARAVREALRVLRPGGRLFAAFITRYAPFRVAATKNPRWLGAHPDYTQQLIDTGQHDQPTTFAQAYYAWPHEVIPFMEGCGLTTLSLIGCEGVVAGHEEGVNELDGDEWAAWVDLNYELGQQPSLHGASDHLLYVGQK